VSACHDRNGRHQCTMSQTAEGWTPPACSFEFSFGAEVGQTDAA
jgi:hypothetical protein